MDYVWVAIDKSYIICYTVDVLEKNENEFELIQLLSEASLHVRLVEGRIMKIGNTRIFGVEFRLKKYAVRGLQFFAGKDVVAHDWRSGSIYHGVHECLGKVLLPTDTPEDVLVWGWWGNTATDHVTRLGNGPSPYVLHEGAVYHPSIDTPGRWVYCIANETAWSASRWDYIQEGTDIPVTGYNWDEPEKNVCPFSFDPNYNIDPPRAQDLFGDYFPPQTQPNLNSEFFTTEYITWLQEVLPICQSLDLPTEEMIVTNEWLKLVGSDSRQKCEEVLAKVQGSFNELGTLKIGNYSYFLDEKPGSDPGKSVIDKLETLCLSEERSDKEKAAFLVLKPNFDPRV